jgi:hypothetical protein
MPVQRKCNSISLCTTKVQFYPEELTWGRHYNNNNNSFGIVNWNQEQLQKLDRKTRKLLTIHGQHYPKTDIDRLYVPRNQGGRGLMKLEAAHTVEITNLAEYIDRKEDPLIEIVRTHQHNTNSAMLQTARCLTTEVQRETRKMKWRKQKKNGMERGCMDNGRGA